MPAPYPTYHVGDRVIVRTWNDMMEEFGSDPYGDIAVHPNKLSFILGMKPFCGKEFIVVKIVHDKDLPDEPIYFLNYSPDAYVDLMMVIFLTVGPSPPPCSSPQPSPMNLKTVFPPLLLPSMIYFKELYNYGYCP